MHGAKCCSHRPYDLRHVANAAGFLAGRCVRLGHNRRADLPRLPEMRALAGFHISFNHFCARHAWPERMPAYRQTLMIYFDGINRPLFGRLGDSPTSRRMPCALVDGELAASNRVVGYDNARNGNSRCVFADSAATMRPRDSRAEMSIVA